MLRASLTLLMVSAFGSPLATDPEPVGFPVLAGYEYEEGMTLPKEVTDLDEKVVAIRIGRRDVEHVADIRRFPREIIGDR